jgi:hypothetical protein
MLRSGVAHAIEQLQRTVNERRKQLAHHGVVLLRARGVRRLFHGCEYFL